MASANASRSFQSENTCSWLTMSPFVHRIKTAWLRFRCLTFLIPIFGSEYYRGNSQIWQT